MEEKSKCKYRKKSQVFLCYTQGDGHKGKIYLNKYQVKIILSMAAVKLSGKCSNNIKMIFVLTRRRFCLTAYPIDSSAPVFSIICSKDFEEDVGVGAIVGELQETGETAHTKLQGRGKAREGLHIGHHFSFRFQG